MGYVGLHDVLFRGVAFFRQGVKGLTTRENAASDFSSAYTHAMLGVPS